MYKQVTSLFLPEVRARWHSSSSSKALTSILLQSKNFLVSHAAAISNKAISLSSPRTLKSKKIPKQLRKSGNKLSQAHSLLKQFSSCQNTSPALLVSAQARVMDLRRSHRRLVRWNRCQESLSRDSAWKSSPMTLCKTVKGSYIPSTKPITSLSVGDKVYEDEHIPDGFYGSISSLKKA